MLFSGVAGGAASGKTTVCDMIMQQLHDQRAVVVNQVILLFRNVNNFDYVIFVLISNHKWLLVKYIYI